MKRRAWPPSLCHRGTASSRRSFRPNTGCALTRAFFATPRSVQGRPQLFSLNELNQGEKEKYDSLEAELIHLRNAASGESPEEESIFSRSWLFRDGGLVTFVCAQLPEEVIGEFGDPENPNYTELQTYADIDALVELLGHIRSENSTATVHYKIPRDVKPDDLTGHLILLGGVVWNDIAGRISKWLSCR